MNITDIINIDSFNTNEESDYYYDDFSDAAEAEADAEDQRYDESRCERD